MYLLAKIKKAQEKVEALEREVAGCKKVVGEEFRSAAGRLRSRR